MFMSQFIFSRMKQEMNVFSLVFLPHAHGTYRVVLFHSWLSNCERIIFGIHMHSLFFFIR